MPIKGIVLCVVRCVIKEEFVSEYARLFSVIVGIEKEPMYTLTHMYTHTVYAGVQNDILTLKNHLKN